MLAHNKLSFYEFESERLSLWCSAWSHILLHLKKTATWFYMKLIATLCHQMLMKGLHFKGLSFCMTVNTHVVNRPWSSFHLCLVRCCGFVGVSSWCPAWCCTDVVRFSLKQETHRFILLSLVLHLTSSNIHQSGDEWKASLKVTDYLLILFIIQLYAW